MPQDQTPTQAANQTSIKVGDFEFPGLAFDANGQITVASWIDMLTISLAALRNPQVDEILKANKVIIKDNSGRLFFPRPYASENVPQ